MPRVNTYVNAFDTEREVMVTLAPGDEIPDSVIVTNPDVIGDPPIVEAEVAVGAGQTETFDPDSASAVEKASLSLQGDGLDRKSHAELDVVLEDERVDLSDVDTPTRQQKIDAIRARRSLVPDE